MIDPYDPRVRVVDEATGKVTPVRRDELHGIDEFLASITSNPDLPQEYRMQGWQQSDEHHKVGDGRPGYRVVFKTLRTASTGPAAVVSSNCRVLIANDKVTWGEPRFGRALKWRRTDRHVIPDWGRVYYQPLRFVRAEDNTIPFEAHEETTPPMNFVEVLYILDEQAADAEHQDKLATARAAVAPLLASIDLAFGPRLLGPRITEEIGEVFEDWHWNRQLNGSTVALEAQAEFRFLGADAIVAQIGSIFDANQARSEEDRARLRIAAQWYWRADAEHDPVQGFIAYWLTIEALEMSTSDIAPVKAAVDVLLGGDRVSTAAAVGRLFGLRSRLLHGKVGAVSSRQLHVVGAVARALLEVRLLGILSPKHRDALKKAITEASVEGF